MGIIISEVSFDTTKEEAQLIRRIVERARPIFERQGVPFNVQDRMMDLAATHANGCPLDFQKFLDFDDFNFSHDFVGIFNCLNRDTGRLERHFLPRCSKPKGA